MSRLPWFAAAALVVAGLAAAVLIGSREPAAAGGARALAEVPRIAPAPVGAPAERDRRSDADPFARPRPAVRPRPAKVAARPVQSPRPAATPQPEATATPQPLATPAPATPRRKPVARHAVHETDLRISPLGELRSVRRDVPRFETLPSPRRPYATFLGRVDRHRTAAFVVLPGLSVLGGDCLPTRERCALLTLRSGDQAWIGLPDGAAWRLDVTRVRRVTVTSKARARAARARRSRAGECVLARLGFPPASVAAAGLTLSEGPPAVASGACPSP